MGRGKSTEAAKKANKFANQLTDPEMATIYSDIRSSGAVTSRAEFVDAVIAHDIFQEKLGGKTLSETGMDIEKLKSKLDLMFFSGSTQQPGFVERVKTSVKNDAIAAERDAKLRQMMTLGYDELPEKFRAEKVDPEAKRRAITPASEWSRQRAAQENILKDREQKRENRAKMATMCNITATAAWTPEGIKTDRMFSTSPDTESFMDVNSLLEAMQEQETANQQG